MSNTDSRVKKSLLNARVNLIFYFLVLILSFFSRKIFLDTLGAEFIGFTSTLQNLLGFLNLAELGIATAIGYILYKPLFEHDELKINEIVSVLGYLYRCIGVVILAAGMILSIFLPLIFPNTEFKWTLIYFAYYSFLASSLIGYFINYRQNLLGADQKNYVVVGYFQSANILKTLLQIFLAYYYKNYYIWVAIELTFGILYSFVLNWKINQTYPWLKSEISEGRKLMKKYPEVVKYTKQLFVQKISSIVQWQTVPFLTYAFASLQMVAYYGNYTIITDKLAQFVNTFLESTGAGVGNLIAEGNKDNIKKVFWELISIRYFIGGVISFAIYMLINPFIALWLGDKYILDDIILILIVINVFISYTRGGVMQFNYGYGLFWDVWAPIAEIVINLGVACSCGALWGLPGVLLGGIVSQILIVNIWKPYLLFHWGFKDNVLEYVGGIGKILFLVMISILLVTYIADHYINIIPNQSFLSWALYGGIVVCTYMLVLACMFFCFVQQFRFFVHRFIHKSSIK